MWRVAKGMSIFSDELATQVEELTEVEEAAVVEVLVPLFGCHRQ